MTDSDATALDGLNRELYKARLELQAALREIQQRGDTIAAELSGLHHSERELAALRMTNEALREHTEEWFLRAVDFLKVLESALSSEQLDPRMRAAMEKDAQSFLRIFSAMGVDVIIPAPGTPFDARLHNVVREDENGGDTVQSCLGWGFRWGDRIMRQADVVLGPPLEPDARPRSDDTFPDGVQPAASGRATPTKLPGHTGVRTHNLVLYVFLAVFTLFNGGLHWAGLMRNSTPEEPVQITQTGQSEETNQEFLTQCATKLDAMESRLATLTELIEPIRTMTEQTTAPEPSDEPHDSMYLVQAGDTLWGIAGKLLGDGRAYKSISAANHLRGNLIKPGMILRIPEMRDDQR